MAAWREPLPHSTLPAVVSRRLALDAQAIFGDSRRSTLSHFLEAKCVDDERACCRLCRDRWGDSARFCRSHRRDNGVGVGAYRDAAGLEVKPVGRAFAIKLPKNDTVD